MSMTHTQYARSLGIEPSIIEQLIDEGLLFRMSRPADRPLLMCSAAVRALAAGRGVRTVDLAPMIGIGKTPVFADLKG